MLLQRCADASRFDKRERGAVGLVGNAKRRWFPKAPPYRAPATRAQWPGWLGALGICFLIAFFVGRRGNNSVLEVWGEQDAYARQAAAIRAEAQESPADALRRKAVEAMRMYWEGRVTLYNASETIWWRPDYEGFIQGGAKKARELDLPFYALSKDDIYEIASQCCANYCSMPEDEPVLVPPPDMRIAKTRRGVPEGCATP